METSDPTPEPAAKPTPWLGCILVLGIFFVLSVFALGPIHIGPIRSRENSDVRTAHAIGLALYSYANDNNQLYPDGSSSTEAFQKLLDGGYVTDPALFYIPMPGKTPAVPGQKLKPENVSWDLTAPAESRMPLPLPLLFITGYKVNYVPGGAAVPLIPGTPLYGTEPLRGTILQPPFSAPPVRKGIAVFYINNSATFLTPKTGIAPDGSIPNFIPPDFKPDGRTYRQLTPDGVLR